MPGSSRLPKPESPAAALRMSQMVSLMLIIGLLIGGGALGFLGRTRIGSAPGAGIPPAPATLPRPAEGDPFAVIVPVVAVLALAITVWLPFLLVKEAKKRWESRADDDAAMRRVYEGFMRLTIIQGAALEGPGLLGAVATYLTGNWLMLLATLASVVLITLLFPRTSRIDRWIDEVTGQPPTPVESTPTPLADDEAA